MSRQIANLSYFTIVQIAITKYELNSQKLDKKCPYSELFWSLFSRIRTELRRDTPYLSVFSPNAGKCGPEWLRIRTPFTQWKCQTDSIMTHNWELCQSGFSVLPGRLIIKLSKSCLLCTYVDQMIIQQRFNVLFQLQFYIIFINVLFIIFKSFH